MLPGVLEKAGELPVASFEVEAAFADVIEGDLDLVGLASRFFGGLSKTVSGQIRSFTASLRLSLPRP